MDREEIEATLSNVSNPAVILDGRRFNLDPSIAPDMLTSNTSLIAHLEAIKQTGATYTGFNSSIEGIPTIVPVYPAPGNNDGIDNTARAVCMKQAHKAIPMTFGMNLAATPKVPGTIPYCLVNARTYDKSTVNIGHPSGIFAFGADTDGEEVVTTKVVRTARPLIEGFVNFGRRRAVTSSRTSSQLVCS